MTHIHIILRDSQCSTQFQKSIDFCQLSHLHRLKNFIGCHPALQLHLLVFLLENYLFQSCLISLILVIHCFQHLQIELFTFHLIVYLLQQVQDGLQKVLHFIYTSYSRNKWLLLL